MNSAAESVGHWSYDLASPKTPALDRTRVRGVSDTEPSEYVLRGLLAAAPDALLAIDPAGVIVFVNDEAERLFGWTKADLIGQRVEVLIPERFTERHPALRSGYFRQPVTRPMGVGLELLALRRDGSEFPAEISLSGYSTAEGTLVAVAIRDVTVARKNEQRFRAVLASAPDAMLGVDSAGRIELLNEQAERLFGWSRDELVGQLIEVLVPESMRGVHVHHRAHYVEDPLSRPMGAGLQLAARRKDGSSFPAEISLSAVQEEHGELLILASIRDISDRAELEEERRNRALAAQREQAHRLESLGQLAGGVAHDFNNLLGVILNYATLLTRRVTDPQALVDIAEISAASERAATLTRQLLAFARRETANPEPMIVNDVVRDFSSLLERTLGEHIELHLEVTAQEPMVMMDRHQFEQILLNLALNGRDAMPAGGVLTITTVCTTDGGRPGSGRVTIEVSDTGHGMTPEVLARVFEPFFTTKPRGEGTGLGLATVHGIVHQNGGAVAIESSLDTGTKVAVTFPRLDGAFAIPRAPAAALIGGREKILLVEDEPSLRVATARILSEHGYDVVAASDGVEALKAFDQLGGVVDVVLTDLAMPRMRGDDLARLLASRRASVRLIFMSGFDSGDTPLPGRLLHKPVSESDLLLVIRETLDGVDGA
jgi:PAS domain S-box-containing protein